MMKITLGTDAASRKIADGSLPQLMGEVLGPLQPEAAYFGPENGMRTAWIVFDLEDPSLLPQITEPLFRELSAKVQMIPVMNQEDLQKGLGQIAG